MATSTEALRVPQAARRASKTPGKGFTKAIAEWYRKGQLGSSSTTEMGRYTGARV